ncbi:hypothetical protein VTJ83DRAFT_6764 [Remersonia thermophila]|uniref:Transmembrane protein n=1 Tax=Remersonia thermophila TaxID=72144 RepID=A0ABR4D7T8_9PEZI
MAPRTSFRHMLAAREDLLEPSTVPLAGLITGVVLSLSSIAVLSAFTVQRYLAVKNWRRLPIVKWGMFILIIVANFFKRFARLENGMCIIGLERPAVLPLIVYDIIANIYLTVLFLKPLYNLYSFKNYARSTGNDRLKTMALRTFIACICALTSGIVNLSVLVAMDGEPGWVCLMSCTGDILFSAIVIHWITSYDQPPREPTASTASGENRGRKGASGASGGSGAGGEGELHAISPRTTHFCAREDDENDLLDNDLDNSSEVSKTKRIYGSIDETAGNNSATTTKPRSGSNDSNDLVGGQLSQCSTVVHAVSHPTTTTTTSTAAEPSLPSTTSTSTPPTTATTITTISPNPPPPCGSGFRKGSKPSHALRLFATPSCPSLSSSFSPSTPTAPARPKSSMLGRPDAGGPSFHVPLQGVHVERATSVTNDTQPAGRNPRLGHTVVIATTSGGDEGRREVVMAPVAG